MIDFSTEKTSVKVGYEGKTIEVFFCYKNLNKRIKFS
jgi:hypothetical protein